MKFIDIVFDGPPGPEAGRFVEVEDESGKSIRFGEWVQRPDKYWALRINQAMTPDIEALVARLERMMSLNHNGAERLRDDTIAALREQAREIERLKQELKAADAFERSVNEALNSGDGSYRP